MRAYGRITAWPATYPYPCSAWWSMGKSLAGRRALHRRRGQGAVRELSPPSHRQAIGLAIADEAPGGGAGKMGANDQGRRISVVCHEGLAGAVSLDRISVRRRAPIGAGKLAGMVHQIPSNDGFLAL